MLEFPYAPPAHLRHLAAGPYVIPFTEQAATDSGMVGGKNANLATLIQAGYPVPPGFAIPAHVFQSLIPDPQALVQMVKDNRLEEAQQYVKAMQVPEQDFYHAFDQLGVDEVAVRSSALSEDSAEHAFAGRYRTLLFQTRNGHSGTHPDQDVGLIQAIKDCWASFFEEMGVTYRGNVGSLDDLGMAVAVLAMVPAQSAGTAFTEDPTGHLYVKANTINVQAVAGVGESLVSGEAEPDTYRIDKQSGKTQQIEISNGGVLTADHVTQLAQLAHSLERHFESPQDIEWAIDPNGEVKLLQARPITA